MQGESSIYGYLTFGIEYFSSEGLNLAEELAESTPFDARLKRFFINND
jgi:hypothetical protein